MLDSPYVWGAIVNLCPGVVFLIWMACKGDWRGMLLSSALIFCGAFWVFLYPEYFSHREPYVCIILNIVLAFWFVSHILPPQAPTHY